jgi:two-component sensor histidine kinase
VKNNLQTVAALLRLQARRMDLPEARAALEEAMRRVSTIALVHESLSQTLDEVVEFDDMVGRALRLAADVASADTSVRTVRTGSFGLIPAEVATPLALVLTELVTNAVEHGLASKESGTVEIAVERDGTALSIVVADDGVGMPGGVAQAGRSARSGLGTQIVSTLVTNELGGTIRWEPREGGGTRVVLALVLPDPGRGRE